MGFAQTADGPDDQGVERRGKIRPSVNFQCELRVGTRAWHQVRLADFTPSGFKVRIIDMPPRGTPVYVRIGNLQMLQAQVCWTEAVTAGCEFATPLKEYVFDHILTAARG